MPEVKEIQDGWYRCWVADHLHKPFLRYIKNGTAYYCDPADEDTGKRGPVTQYAAMERLNIAIV